MIVRIITYEKEHPFMMRLEQLSLDSEPAGKTFSSYCSFAYSALVSFRMGMLGSASFRSVRRGQARDCRRADKKQPRISAGLVQSRRS